MNICIGIISYLPDEQNLRDKRLNRLINLLKQCDEFFKLPILLVAQNFKNDFNFMPINSKLYIYNYKNKLGITGARINLRKYFLMSSFDNIILLDDDMKLTNEDNAIKYLREIDGKYDFYYIKSWLLNFSCISKNGMKKIIFEPEIEPEKGLGFEDWVFYEKCLKILNKKAIVSYLPVGKRRDYLNDKYSTWITPELANSNKNASNSLTIIKKVRNGKI